MKSLMEEASSVSKAIEKGWANAGKPKEFSIKVYEEPEKNFFGITTKSAKIGIFFDETRPVEGRPRRGRSAEPSRGESQRGETQRAEVPRAETPRAEIQRSESQRKELPKKIKETALEEPRKAEPAREELGPIWSDDMVLLVKGWLTDMLPLLGMDTAAFTIDSQRFHLRITFSTSLIPDKDKQKHFFAVLSGLLLTMLKRHHKRPLRGYKIVLTEVS